MIMSFFTQLVWLGHSSIMFTEQHWMSLRSSRLAQLSSIMVNWLMPSHS
jgi:hypothetical protein